MSALAASTPADKSFDLVEYRYALHLGDTSLILAQRLGELIGHCPALEEDLAIGNIGLDLIGQARYLLSHAATLEQQGRTEDDLAFLRDPSDYTNLTIVEQPNGDFGHTIVRQFLVDAWQLELFEQLQDSTAVALAELAARAIKETRYHLRFSAGWLIRLGDGTAESHQRVQTSLEALWPFTGELFTANQTDEQAAAAGFGVNLQRLRIAWDKHVNEVLREATLIRPTDVCYPWHGKNGQHGEHLSHLLTDMQFMQRTYPGAQW